VLVGCPAKPGPYQEALTTLAGCSRSIRAGLEETGVGGAAGRVLHALNINPRLIVTLTKLIRPRVLGVVRLSTFTSPRSGVVVPGRMSKA
jgi:hypothetical protein